MHETRHSRLQTFEYVMHFNMHVLTGTKKYFVKRLDTNIKVSFLSFTCEVCYQILKIQLTRKNFIPFSFNIENVFNILDAKNVWQLSSRKLTQDSVHLWKYASVLKRWNDNILNAIWKIKCFIFFWASLFFEVGIRFCQEWCQRW